MDVKTLSTIIGHVSTATTLNIYAHITDDMRQKAARKIDQGIGKSDVRETETPKLRSPDISGFQPYRGKRRKAGTGCISQSDETLWEGRYSTRGPDGKRRTRNIYAHSEEACEAKLAELIEEMKAELAAEEAQRKGRRQTG